MMTVADQIPDSTKSAAEYQPDDANQLADKLLQSIAFKVYSSDDDVIREAAAMLRTRAAPPAMDREAVARIIDPTSFCDVPYTDDPIMIDMVKTWQDTALAKADAILSTLSADAIRQGEGITQFGAVVFQQVWDSFIDGGWDIEVNDLITKDALKAGLVSVEPFDPKGHVDPYGAAQPGDDFYQLTDAGREAFATPDATPASHASDGGK